MISIRVRPHFRAIRLCIALILLTLCLPRPASGQAAPNLDDLGSLVRLVQRESMFDPSTSTLIEGASASLHTYLEQLGEVPAVALQTTVDGLRREFEDAAARHPDVDRRELYYAAMRGLLKPLEEPYTRFLTPSEFEHLQARVDGVDECGLGCHLELDREQVLTVVETFRPAPAAETLMAGDRILAVNGRSTSRLSLSAGKELLIGPEGSRVRLTVRRDGHTLALEVQRTRNEVPNITHEMLGDGVGYIRLHAFSAGVAKDLDAALSTLERAGAVSYVLDLRDNRGGYVASAVDVCSRFLPAGTKIMSLQQKGNKTLSYVTYPSAVHTGRLVVLVNERSASASEIVAGCLQDYKIATLVGTRTYGKGLVQKLIPLPDGSALAISTGKYLTAGGRDLHRHGIPPDVIFRETAYTVAALDPQVQRAVRLLTRTNARMSGVQR